MGGKTTRTTADKVAGFQLNDATYGVVTTVCFGTAKIAGNLIDYFDFTAIPHTETTRTGKGGGGKTESTTYTYTGSVIVGLAEGPCNGIGKIWVGTDVYSSLSGYGFTLIAGTSGQAPWSYILGKYPTRALPYDSLAYVVNPATNLGNDGTLPTLNFEYKGLLTDSMSTGDTIDVNPADVIKHIIFDSRNGIGFGNGTLDTESWQRYHDFCQAADLLISAPITDTTKAYTLINNICEMTNTYIVCSQNKLKFIPQCDDTLSAHGATYTPYTTPLYDLTEEDFIKNKDGQMVVFERADNSEAYNHITVSFTNRLNSYEEETAEYKVDADINKRGIRSKSTTDLTSFIYTKARAEYLAQLEAMEELYSRNTYSFKLGWAHCLLEPGDFVTILDPAIKATKIPVVITSVKEDSTGTISFTAKGRPPGIYSPAIYDTHEADRGSINYQVDPGDINPPVIFEVPADLTGGDSLQAWIAVSGKNVNWGGAEIWISFDNMTYSYVGDAKRSRHGTLINALPDGADIDTTNTLSVDLSLALGALANATQDDVDNLRTLCYVDGEIIAYKDATLTAANKYDLTYLKRALYSTTSSAHAAGSQFARLDSSIFKYDFDEKYVGRTIYLKFLSFNIYRASVKDISTVTPVTYTLKYAPAPDIDTYYCYQNFRQIEHVWRVSGNAVAVEIRKLDSSNPLWDTGKVVNTMVPGNNYTDTGINLGISHYGIKAISANGSYSKNMVTSIINVSYIPSSNFVIALNEFDNLDGTLEECYIENNIIYMQFADFWCTAAEENTTEDYWCTTDEEVSGQDYWNLPVVALAAYTTQIKDIQKILTSIVAVSDLISTANCTVYWRYGNTQAELEAKEFSKFVSGSYTFRYHQWKITMTNGSTVESFSKFSISIDTPDRELKYPNTKITQLLITDAAAGVRVTYDEAFTVRPIITGTVLNSDAYIVVAESYPAYCIIKAKSDYSNQYITGEITLRIIGY